MSAGVVVTPDGRTCPAPRCSTGTDVWHSTSAPRLAVQCARRVEQSGYELIHRRAPVSTIWSGRRVDLERPSSSHDPVQVASIVLVRCG